MGVKVVDDAEKVSFCLDSGLIHYINNDGETVISKLGKKDCEVFRYLIEREGELISREDILTNVWRDKIVGYNTVSVSLSNIRRYLKKIDDDCACLINISGRGYLFSARKSGLNVLIE